MNRVQFWILNGVSLVLVLLIGFELHSEHQLEAVSEMLKQAQIPVLQAQQNMPLVQQMVQRTALGATRDSALKDLLTKYGFQLTLKSQGSVPAEFSAPLPSNPTPSTNPS